MIFPASRFDIFRKGVPLFWPAAAAFLFFILRSVQILPQLLSFDFSSMLWVAARPVADTLAAVLLLFVIFGAGRCAPSGFRRSLCSSGGSLRQFALSCGIGIGILALVTFLLAAAGLTNRFVFAVVFVGFFAAGFPSAVFLISDMSAKARVAGIKFESALFLCVTLYVFLHLYAGSLTPPADWDSLAYHLALLKIYAENGAMTQVPWMLHSCFPLNMEMIFFAAERVFGRDISQLANFTVIILSSAVVFALAEKFSRSAAFLAVCLFASFGAVHQSPASGSDFALMLFVLLSVMMYLRHREDNLTASLAAAAFFAGLAAGAKYTGLFYPAVLTAVIFREKGLKRAAIFLGISALTAAPWYVRNIIWTANPVWPFFHGIFGGAHWSRGAAEVYFKSNAFDGASLSLKYFLTLPPRLVVDHKVYGYMPHFFVPVFAFAAVFTALKKRIPPYEIIFFAAIAALNYSVWFYHGQIWRFLLPSLALLCVALAWALSSTVLPLRAALIAVCIFPVAGLDSKINILPAAGIKSRADPSVSPYERFLDLSVDSHRMYRHINTALPPSVKILLFRELRGYHLERDYQWGDPVNQDIIKYGADVSPRDLRIRLKEYGITHVLVNENRYHSLPYYYTSEILESMERFLGRYARLTKEIDGVFLYELKPL